MYIYTHTHTCSLYTLHQSGTTHEARPKIEFPTLFFLAERQTNFVQMKFKTLASLMKINTDLLWGGSGLARQARESCNFDNFNWFKIRKC